MTEEQFNEYETAVVAVKKGDDCEVYYHDTTKQIDQLLADVILHIGKTNNFHPAALALCVLENVEKVAGKLGE